MKVKVRIHADPVAIELTKLQLDIDPFGGIWWEELLPDLDRQIKTVDGCKSIIECNIETIREMLEERGAILDENSALNEKARKLEAELKNANELMGGYKNV